MSNKPVSMKRLMGTKPKGSVVLASYLKEATARRKVAQLKKQGYRSHCECIMGNWQVWVNQKYFRDHPRAKSHYGMR